jgi:hypothetical protein
MTIERRVVAGVVIGAVVVVLRRQPLLTLRLFLLLLRLRPGECNVKRHLELGGDDVVLRAHQHRLEDSVVLGVEGGRRRGRLLGLPQAWPPSYSRLTRTKGPLEVTGASRE